MKKIICQIQNKIGKKGQISHIHLATTHAQRPPLSASSTRLVHLLPKINASYLPKVQFNKLRFNTVHPMCLDKCVVTYIYLLTFFLNIIFTTPNILCVLAIIHPDSFQPLNFVVSIVLPFSEYRWNLTVWNILNWLLPFSNLSYATRYPPCLFIA